MDTVPLLPSYTGMQCMTPTWNIPSYITMVQSHISNHQLALALQTLHVYSPVSIYKQHMTIANLPTSQVTYVCSCYKTNKNPRVGPSTTTSSPLISCLEVYLFIIIQLKLHAIQLQNTTSTTFSDTLALTSGQLTPLQCLSIVEYVHSVMDISSTACPYV